MSSRPYSRFAEAILAGTSFVAADFGARGGLPRHWRGLTGLADFVCVEGDSDAAQTLQNLPRTTVISELLTRNGGPRTLYRTNRPSASSLFDPDQILTREYVDRQHIYPVAETAVNTAAAAPVFAEANISRIDMAKLDLQGAELELMEALESGPLKPTLCIEVETAWMDKGADHPRFSDVDSHLRARGFDLFDLRLVKAHRALDGSRAAFQALFDVHRSSASISARLREADALYFRNAGALLDEGKPEDVRRLAVAYGIYGYFSEAWQLAGSATDRKLFSREEGDAVKHALKAWHRFTHRRWRHGAGRLPAQIRWWLERMGLVEKANW